VNRVALGGHTLFTSQREREREREREIKRKRGKERERERESEKVRKRKRNRERDVELLFKRNGKCLGPFSNQVLIDFIGFANETRSLRKL
jgi:hypothetical protein